MSVGVDVVVAEGVLDGIARRCACGNTHVVECDVIPCDQVVAGCGDEADPLLQVIHDPVCLVGKTGAADHVERRAVEQDSDLVRKTSISAVGGADLITEDLIAICLWGEENPCIVP